MLVCYDELMSEDCPEEHLHEWFSYVKAAKPLAKRVAAPYKINTGRGYQLRPKPSSQVVACSQHILQASILSRGLGVHVPQLANTI